MSSVIAGKNLRIVWKENSQVALILFRTFRSTALPPQTLFFLKTRTWHETSAAICQTSLRWGFFLFVFFCFSPIYQPEGCTDQHFTQALHFHWTKQTLRTARVNFSGEMRRTTLIFFFYAWSFLKMMCLIYLNIKKKNTAIIPSLVLKVATITQKGRSMFYFFLEQCCESYEL